MKILPCPFVSIMKGTRAKMEIKSARYDRRNAILDETLLVKILVHGFEGTQLRLSPPSLRIKFTSHQGKEGGVFANNHGKIKYVMGEGEVFTEN